MNDTKNKYLFILINKINTGKHTVRYISDNPRKYAQMIYSLWHEAEDKKYRAIFIEKPDSRSCWSAIIDRISKASNLIIED